MKSLRDISVMADLQDIVPSDHFPSTEKASNMFHASESGVPKERSGIGMGFCPPINRTSAWSGKRYAGIPPKTGIRNYEQASARVLHEKWHDCVGL
jgi:hypothetical protein